MGGFETIPYCGVAPVPGELLGRWNLDPAILAGFVALGAIWWAVGDRGAWRAFIGGVALLALALVSPFCALTTALFSARSLHHLVVLAGAAPLLALAFPRPRSGSSWPALIASSAILWLWHWPPVYAASFDSHAVYWMLQLGLIASFVWFWRAVLAPHSAVSGLAAIAAGAGQMGLLAALLTFAPEPLYAVHGAAPHAWGLTPLADQQLGGLLMWVPAFLVYGAVAILRGRQAVREVAP